MTYFDTDVLVHSFVVQEPDKYRQANDLVEEATRNSTAVISILSVQETLFVLNRLGVDIREMNVVFEDMMQLQPIAYDLAQLRRAFDLAEKVGFSNINDCIHAAIAEEHCTELVTYNRRDFSRIREFARVGITIL